MSFSIIQGDALTVLREMESGSVQCCISSPPYYGLRDYGTAQWEGGDDPACDHDVTRWEGDKQTQGAQSSHAARADRLDRESCARCGATRVDKQIGLEKTPEEFLDRLVAVFREVRRVLRDDGTLWVNMGDSYAGSWGAQGRQGKTGELAGRSGNYQRQIAAAAKRSSHTGSIPRESGLKPKDLMGMPWALAFALRADGWYLRQDIIWHKPNPMPESVKDRCTKAHEYVFLLSKSQRYWWDADAMREPAVGSTPHDLTGPGYSAPGQTDQRGNRKGNARTFRGGGAYVNGRSFDNSVQAERSSHGNAPNESGKRNRRSVWTLATQPTPEAHFATFPLELPEICLKAGCPEGGTVLDPFAGAGTTGLACLKNGRQFIGIELNPAYIEIAMERARKHYPLLVA